MSSTLTAIVAMTPAGVIGDRGDMPWRLSRDLRRFKRVTMGGTLIMGRKTYDSIGKPLPGRQTIVVTRTAAWAADGVAVASSPDQALQLAAKRRAFVVGGAEIYRQLIDHCSEVLLTRVWSAIDGDTRLQLDLTAFRCFEVQRFPAGPRDDVPTDLIHWVRRKS